MAETGFHWLAPIPIRWLLLCLDGSDLRAALARPNVLVILTDDPLEQHNLIADPRQARQRGKLERALEMLSRQIGPDPIPLYEGITNVLPKY